MKRQWILAVAVGMALLAAKPTLGDDKNVTNAKKSTTDTKKPASNANKPATDAQKPSAKKNRDTTPPSAKSNPAVTTRPAPPAKPVSSAKPVSNAKPVANAKPVVNASPKSIAKLAPQLDTAANSKPASNAKPAIGAKAVVQVTQPTLVKPMANAKTVINGKPAITAKPSSPNAKPVPKSAAKVASNPPRVMNSKPALNTNVIQKANPAVAIKPAANGKFSTRFTPPVGVKRYAGNKPVVATSATTIVPKPAQKGLAVSVQLPARYEQMNPTSLQRQKAAFIMNKYSVQISNLESMLNNVKAAREKELSALLTPPQQTQPGTVKDESPAKPSNSVGLARSTATTGQVKSASNKPTTEKRDNATASVAPIPKDKLGNTTHGQK